MTLCGRCRAPVVDQARFCSECGGWVVHPPPVRTTSPEATTGTDPMTLETGAASVRGMLTGAEAEDHAERAKSSKAILGERPGAKRDSARPPPFKVTDVHRTSPLSRDSVPISRAARTIADSSPPPMSVARSSPRPKRPLAGFLVSFQYEPLGTFWPLGIGPNTVGRAGSQAAVDVGLADITVSTDQALIMIESTGAALEDRGSTNGTFLNGRAVAAGARVAMRHGDHVRFGSFETVLVVVPHG